MYSFNIHSGTHRDICIFLAEASATHSSSLQSPADVFQCYLSCGKILSRLLRNICLKCFPSRMADVLFFFCTIPHNAIFKNYPSGAHWVSVGTWTSAGK